MQRYVVGICGRVSCNNEIKIIESHDGINAVFNIACTERKEIISIKEKLLNDHKTINELRKYFIDYWGLSITSPYKLGV